MKCIIVDDEPLAVDLIVAYVERVGNLEIVATTNDPLEALNLLQTEEIELVFLDIEMPNLTGLELVKTLSKLPQFIFTTAYPQYALDGFELNATDYLVKPIPFPRFVKAVSKAREFHELKLKENNPLAVQDDFIFVKSEYENIKIKTTDITHIEGLKDYIKIHIHGSSRSTLTLMSFKDIMEKLPTQKFLRIHRSYIINIDYVSSHQKNKLVVGNERLPIGETYKNEVMKRLGI
ncbi:response regulator [Leptobacterium flavescens]|uniref:Response regulator n=1 Tax=Leptobacterium flavescens TaxID=472055 RepID=A0A6P0UJB9_9FLAO|nr:LytTR family DNA-binding domain-containing protein [Leptobacterium flavescens]NER13471.1 response regulator [Leptobacterium flavescens]